MSNKAWRITPTGLVESKQPTNEKRKNATVITYDDLSDEQKQWADKDLLGESLRKDGRCFINPSQYYNKGYGKSMFALQKKIEKRVKKMKSSFNKILKIEKEQRIMVKELRALLEEELTRYNKKQIDGIIEYWVPPSIKGIIRRRTYPV